MPASSVSEEVKTVDEQGTNQSKTSLEVHKKNQNSFLGLRRSGVYK